MGDSEIYTLFEYGLGNFIEIKENPEETELKVEIIGDRESFGKLEDLIDETWKENLDKHPNSQNNRVPFMARGYGPKQIQNGIGLEVVMGNFSDLIFFNRRAENSHYIEEMANEGRLDTSQVSTHYHIITNDGHVIFAQKSNQFNQMSGFGGFPNADSHTKKLDNGSKILDIYSFINENANKELGNEIAENIAGIYSIGSTYVSRPGLSGSDLNFIVQVDMSADEFIEKFQTSDQFKNGKKIVKVGLNPQELSNYIRETYEAGDEFSPYALGCEAIVMRTLFTEEQNKVYFDTLNDLGIGYSNSLPDFLK